MMMHALKIAKGHNPMTSQQQQSVEITDQHKEQQHHGEMGYADDRRN
jgi:hypothetical protein